MTDHYTRFTLDHHITYSFSCLLVAPGWRNIVTLISGEIPLAKISFNILSLIISTDFDDRDNIRNYLMIGPIPSPSADYLK